MKCERAFAGLSALESPFAIDLSARMSAPAENSVDSSREAPLDLSARQSGPGPVARPGSARTLDPLKRRNTGGAAMADSPKDREADRDRAQSDRARTGIDRRTFLQQGGRAALGLGAFGVSLRGPRCEPSRGCSHHSKIRDTRQDRARHLGHRFWLEWLPERRHRPPLLRPRHELLRYRRGIRHRRLGSRR